MLAEAVGEAPLADQLRTRFLAPLGLDHTCYQPEDERRRTVAHGYRFASAEPTAPAIDLSDGTRGRAVHLGRDRRRRAPAAIAATPRDLARWARALYGGEVLDAGIPRGDGRTSRRTAAAQAGDPVRLGVQAVEIDGRPTLGHSGRLLGFRSAVR